MASGKGLRAKWTGKMAAAIGWNRGRLAHILAHNGLKAPYRKAELKAMQILKGYGLSLAKYTPTEDAVGMEVVPAVVKRLRGFEIVSAPTATVTRKKKGMMPSKSGDGGDASAPPEDDKKKHGSWSDRLLVSRLAKLLPEDATTSGKNRARYILLKAGYPKIKDVDEAKALEVFKQAGIDITNFLARTRTHHRNDRNRRRVVGDIGLHYFSSCGAEGDGGQSLSTTGRKLSAAAIRGKRVLARHFCHR